MAYENLKSAIKQAIKQNGNQEITGSTMQSILLSMADNIHEVVQSTGESEDKVMSQKATSTELGKKVDKTYVDTELGKKFDKASIAQTSGKSENLVMSQKAVSDKLSDLVMSLKAEFSYKGIATPTTNPGVPDSNVFYIAGEGSYPNFGNQVVETGQIAVLKWDGSWNKETIEIGAGGGYMILTWNTDTATTRNQVPIKYRNAGLIVSYVVNNVVVTEQYNSDKKDNSFFGSGLYWTTVNFDIKSGFVNKNGNITININSGTITSTYIKLINGENIINYKGSVLPGNMAAFAIYDKDFKLIKSYYENKGQTVFSNVDIPTNAEYIAFSTEPNNYAEFFTNKRQIYTESSMEIKTINTKIDSLTEKLDTKIDGLTEKLDTTTITAESVLPLLKRAELENGFWNIEGKFSKLNGDWYGNKNLLSIKPGYAVNINPSINRTDNAISLVFLDSDRNVIDYYKLITSPIIAPENAAYFAYTIRGSDDKSSIMTLYEKANYEKSINENRVIPLAIEQSNVQFGEPSLGVQDKELGNFAQLYIDRPYHTRYIAVKKIYVGISRLDESYNKCGLILVGGKIDKNNNFTITQEPAFFNYNFNANSVNEIDVDYLLKPDTFLSILVIGGVLKWGGSGYKGSSNFIGGTRRIINLGESFTCKDTSLLDSNEPSFNKGNFFTFSYDLYKEEEKEPLWHDFLYKKKIGVIGDSESVGRGPNVTWAKEEQDRAEYSSLTESSGHWSEMICKRVGAILNNKGISGTFVFGSPSGKDSAMRQLENLDKDIDYLIVFTGTNGPALQDKNGVAIHTLGDESSPKLSAMPTLIDSNDETFTICGALKWMIEYMYKLFPNAKIGFITPWAYQTRNDEDGSYHIADGKAEGGDFAKAIRMICPLYSIPYFDNVKDSNICWFNDDQRHALMGIEEIVPTISQVKNFKIAATMKFYVKDENAIYKVLTADSNYIPQSWKKIEDNSSGRAYGDGRHVSNSNGHRYLSYKYENFIKSL